MLPTAFWRCPVPAQHLSFAGIVPMKQFGDFIPVAVFFLVYLFSRDLFLATGVLMAVTTAQVAIIWLVRRQVEKPLLYTAAAVLVLGGLTVALHDEMFIKWKPTVVNWVFATVLLTSHFIAKKPLVQKMIEALIEKTGEMKLNAPASLWRRLNLVWVLFFASVGTLNLFVAYQFDEATWVNFRFFGLMGLNAVFFISQFVWLSRYMSALDEKA
jgi:intracellular septation protein